MSRRPWSPDEINDLEANLSWEEFTLRNPGRTYDAWEVKRRRIHGGSAGRGRRSTRLAQLELADELATEVLKVVERYLADTRG